MPQSAYHAETSEHEEEWRPVPGLEGRYSVSSLGRVRAEAWRRFRRDGSPVIRHARILRTQYSRGYVTIGFEGADHVRVAHLVLEVFGQPRPIGAVCCYLNDNSKDVRLSNLAWSEPQELTSPARDEQWRPIPGWEGLYAVSDQGRVLSVERVVLKKSGPARLLPKVRRTHLSRFGYPSVSLCRGSHYTLCRVHELVLAAFVGPRPEGQVCRHLDGNPANNALSNLAYGTHTENMADARRHGTLKCGERCHQAKLNEQQVRAIREAGDVGETQRAVAERFGVSRSTVADIWARRRWRHLP